MLAALSELFVEGIERLPGCGQVEMRLVAAGARSDMEQYDAAVVTLQSPELASSTIHPWTARLRYAYAEALIAAGRGEEARDWFAKAAEADAEGSTNASERLAEIDGLEFVDALAEDEEEAEQSEAPVRKIAHDEIGDDRVIYEDEEDVEEFYDEDDLEIDEADEVDVADEDAQKRD